jgi:hypothetical protein
LLRKITRLRFADWIALGRAQWALITAQLALWIRPRGQLVSRDIEPLTTLTENDMMMIDRLATSVDRVARYGLFRPKCLARSIALQNLLHKSGVVGSSVHIGVRRSGDSFLAHAWVELDGKVLGDSPRYVAGFERLTEVTAVMAGQRT